MDLFLGMILTIQTFLKQHGELDGRWVFINGNNTPRIAKIDLTTFETTEIIEIPNSAGNHSSSFVTENTEYVVAGTRFSVPYPQRDMPIKEYKGNFKGALTFISVDPEDGAMDIKFQIMMPGFNYDLSHPEEENLMDGSSLQLIILKKQTHC